MHVIPALLNVTRVPHTTAFFVTKKYMWQCLLVLKPYETAGHWVADMKLGAMWHREYRPLLFPTITFNGLITKGPLPARKGTHLRSATLAESPSPATEPAAELEGEARLAVGSGDIYGIPRAEWLRLQKPARYLGGRGGILHHCPASAY
jgi:hypothetical protein